MVTVFFREKGWHWGLTACPFTRFALHQLTPYTPVAVHATWRVGEQKTMLKSDPCQKKR